MSYEIKGKNKTITVKRVRTKLNKIKTKFDIKIIWNKIKNKI